MATCMFKKFDGALARLLSGEHTAYGAADRHLALATARRAAAENRVKALNEASLGNTYFAAILENASTRYHEDAEAILKGLPSLNFSIGSYLSMAERFSKLDIKPTETRKVVRFARRHTHTSAA